MFYCEAVEKKNETKTKHETQMKGGYFFTVCQKYDAPFILCMGTGANGYEERHIKNK